jgi:hypothetical protein
MKRLLYSILTLLAGHNLFAQDFAIKRVEVAGNDINLYYNLLDSVAHRTYTITLYSSKDNFISPLEKVFGDVDLEVKPGENKKITWHAKEELGADFDGKVSLEVRGRRYIPFVRLDGNYHTMKRLKNYQFTWTGGTEQNILNFDLYRNGSKVTSFPNIANVGHHTIQLPQDIKSGKGYTFKITDTKNKDQIVNTAPFVVKRKVPLLLKGIPILALAAIIPSLTSSSKKSSDIPAAPGHP